MSGVKANFSAEAGGSVALDLESRARLRWRVRAGFAPEEGRVLLPPELVAPISSLTVASRLILVVVRTIVWVVVRGESDCGLLVLYGPPALRSLGPRSGGPPLRCSKHGELVDRAVVFEFCLFVCAFPARGSGHDSSSAPVGHPEVSGAAEVEEGECEGVECGFDGAVAGVPEIDLDEESAVHHKPTVSPPHSASEGRAVRTMQRVHTNVCVANRSNPNTQASGRKSNTDTIRDRGFSSTRVGRSGAAPGATERAMGASGKLSSGREGSRCADGCIPARTESRKRRP